MSNSKTFAKTMEMKKILICGAAWMPTLAEGLQLHKIAALPAEGDAPVVPPRSSRPVALRAPDDTFLNFRIIDLDAPGGELLDLDVDAWLTGEASPGHGHKPASAAAKPTKSILQSLSGWDDFVKAVQEQLEYHSLSGHYDFERCTIHERLVSESLREKLQPLKVQEKVHIEEPKKDEPDETNLALKKVFRDISFNTPNLGKEDEKKSHQLVSVAHGFPFHVAGLYTHFWGPRRCSPYFRSDENWMMVSEWELGVFGNKDQNAAHYRQPDGTIYTSYMANYNNGWMNYNLLQLLNTTSLNNSFATAYSEAIRCPNEYWGPASNIYAEYAKDSGVRYVFLVMVNCNDGSSFGGPNYQKSVACNWEMPTFPENSDVRIVLITEFWQFRMLHKSLKAMSENKTLTFPKVEQAIRDLDEKTKYFYANQVGVLQAPKEILKACSVPDGQGFNKLLQRQPEDRADSDPTLGPDQDVDV